MALSPSQRQALRRIKVSPVLVQGSKLDGRAVGALLRQGLIEEVDSFCGYRYQITDAGVKALEAS